MPGLSPNLGKNLWGSYEVADVQKKNLELPRKGYVCLANHQRFGTVYDWLNFDDDDQKGRLANYAQQTSKVHNFI